MQLKLRGETITSLELVKQINFFREKENKKTDLKHSDLLKVIRDEFEEDEQAGKISLLFYEAKVGNGATKKFPMFELTLSQAKQVLVRESKFVRRAIIKYIEELESQLQITNNSIMIPISKANYWQRIKELSEYTDNERDKIYKKLAKITKLTTSMTREVDKLSNIVFETENCIRKLER